MSTAVLAAAIITIAIAGATAMSITIAMAASPTRY